MREGDLRGRRVLDVGCGTGTLAAWLAERAAAKVWGVDASPEMLAVARARAPAGVGLKRGRAEQLPFRDGWFDRAIMRLVVHLVDRSAALPELRRVLGDGGVAAIATFDPSHFDAYYLNRLFPSLEGIDRGRFPLPEALAGELGAAGFASTRVVRLTQRGSVSRDDALTRIRGRHISTLALLDEAEYTEGLARAELQLPDLIEYTLEWAIVIGSSGSLS